MDQYFFRGTRRSSSAFLHIYTCTSKIHELP